MLEAALQIPQLVAAPTMLLLLAMPIAASPPLSLVFMGPLLLALKEDWPVHPGGLEKSGGSLPNSMDMSCSGDRNITAQK